MKKLIKDFMLSVLAGIAIGIGGTVFLSVENKLAGAVLFSCGLYIIVTQGLNLFTGKVGYWVQREKPLEYAGFLLVVWLGNFAGTFLVAVSDRASRISAVAERAAGLCELKSADSMLSLFLLGILCGVLMFAAVDGYSKCKNPLILIFCVSVFILCGFEHCIADMFYYTLAGVIDGDVLIRLLVITLGNTAGGVLLPLGAKLAHFCGE